MAAVDVGFQEPNHVNLWVNIFCIRFHISWCVYCYWLRVKNLCLFFKWFFCEIHQFHCSIFASRTLNWISNRSWDIVVEFTKVNIIYVSVVAFHTSSQTKRWIILHATVWEMTEITNNSRLIDLKAYLHPKSRAIKIS